MAFDPNTAHYPPPGHSAAFEDLQRRLPAAPVPGRGFSVTALVFVCGALVIPLLAAPAVFFASRAKKRDDPWAPVVLRISKWSFVAGIISAALIVQAADAESLGLVVETDAYVRAALGSTLSQLVGP